MASFSTSQSINPTTSVQQDLQISDDNQLQVDYYLFYFSIIYN